MDKGLLQQERLQSLKKEQDNGRSSDDEKLKASAAPFEDYDETILSLVIIFGVITNHQRGCYLLDVLAHAAI